MAEPFIRNKRKNKKWRLSIRVDADALKVLFKYLYLQKSIKSYKI